MWRPWRHVKTIHIYTEVYFLWPSIEVTEMYFFFFPRYNFFHGSQGERPWIWSRACGRGLSFWIGLGALPQWVDHLFSLCVFSIRLYNKHLVKDNRTDLFGLYVFSPASDYVMFCNKLCMHTSPVKIKFRLEFFNLSWFVIYVVS